jgi:hypothetical protein
MGFDCSSKQIENEKKVLRHFARFEFLLLLQSNADPEPLVEVVDQ